MVNPYRVAANAGRAVRRFVDTNTKETGRQSVRSSTVDKAPIREFVAAVTQEVSAQYRSTKDARANRLIRKAADKQKQETANSGGRSRRRYAAAARG